MTTTMMRNYDHNHRSRYAVAAFFFLLLSTVSLVNGFVVPTKSQTTLPNKQVAATGVAPTTISTTTSYHHQTWKSFSSSISTTTLFHSHHAAAAAEHVAHEFVSTGIVPVDILLQSELFWSALVMLSIVMLLLAWEESVKTVRETVPQALLAVVESMLAEMGGLGFIGLFLSSFVLSGGVLGGYIEKLSENYLGEEEILLESFEFLHSAFFEVGIGFFLIAGTTVYAVLKEVQKLQQISELALDTDGDGEVSLEELADALNVESLVVDADGDGTITAEEVTDALRHARDIGILSELKMTPSDIAAESLVIRERLILTKGLPDCFLVEKYFEQIFAKHMSEIVELNPKTWLWLLPLVALLQAADLQHEVISASSANAFNTCGEFISTPSFFISTLTFQIVGVVWSLYNFWKMTMVKGMLMPTLVRDGAADGEAVLLPPRVEDVQLRSEFHSTPIFFEPIEKIWGKPPTNDHEGLFGTLGANGKSFFLNSIKLNIWLTVAQVVFYGTDIFARDIAALIQGDMSLVGNPDMLLPEVTVYGLFILLGMGQLYLAPRTFLNYSFATAVESMIDTKRLNKAIRDSIYEYELREGKRYEAGGRGGDDGDLLEVTVDTSGMAYTKKEEAEVSELKQKSVTDDAAAANPAVVLAEATELEEMASSINQGKKESKEVPAAVLAAKVAMEAAKAEAAIAVAAAKGNPAESAESATSSSSDKSKAVKATKQASIVGNLNAKPVVSTSPTTTSTVVRGEPGYKFDRTTTVADATRVKGNESKQVNQEQDNVNGSKRQRIRSAFKNLVGAIKK